MTALHPVSEAERAQVSLGESEIRLRQTHELARRAEETLRRALRDVADAEDALLQATIRLDRVPLKLHRASDNRD